MPDGDRTLVSALSELAALGTGRGREQLGALRVLVVGEARRGTSTLIDVLMRRAVLPGGVTPLTAVTTTVRYGDDLRAEVRFLDGHDEKHLLTALPDLVTERGKRNWPNGKVRYGARGLRDQAVGAGLGDNVCT
jgi:hypothetical protein